MSVGPSDRLAKARALRDAQAKELADQIAVDLSDLLDKSGSTQTEIANALGYGRGWMNKLTHGRREISLQDYLIIVGLLKEFAPDHPAVALSRHLRTRPKPPRLRVVPRE